MGKTKNRRQRAQAKVPVKSADPLDSTSPLLEQHSFTPEQALEFAIQRHRAGHVSDAVVIYKQLLQVNPENADALHLLGVISHQTGKSDVAIALITQALTIKPEFDEAHHNLAMAHRSLGNLEQAEASFRNALAGNPDYFKAHTYLGSVLAQLNKGDEAIASYQAAIAISPTFEDALFGLANVLKQQGRLGEAVDYYHKTLALNPEFADAQFHLGLTFHSLGQTDQAIVHYKKAISLTQGVFTEAYVRLMGLLVRSKFGETDNHSYLTIHFRGKEDPRGIEYYSDASRRDHYAEILQQRVDDLLSDRGIDSPYQNPQLDDDDKQRLMTLRQEGYTSLGRLFDETQIDDIKSYFKALPCYNAYRMDESDGQARFIGEGAENYAYGTYKPEQVLKAPHLLEIANDHRILSLIASYFGCTPSLHSLFSWWSFSGHGEEIKSIQKFHRDFDDSRFCILLIYLTDVGDSNGPHEFRLQTHRFSEQDDTSGEIVVLKGQQGSAFIVDSFGEHRGRPLDDGRRLVFFARYGLGPNGGYAQYMNLFDDPEVLPFAAKSISANLPNDPVSQYINRLIVSL